MRAPVFAANWKMNLGPSDARAFMAAFAARWTARSDRTIVFFPPAVSLSAAVHALGGRNDIAAGAQNIWTEDKGAFTGETSAPMAKDAGARYVLVGHSERRHVFGETDAQTAKKCAAAARHGLTPILCVGELLAEREAGTTADVVLRQLRAGLADVTPDIIARMAIAYEPVWAIGTGRTATPADASEVHERIRLALVEGIGEQQARDVPILYGGSVSAANASALLAANGVDGLLVGGASLDVDSWLSICNT
ncbi:MAG TPA: triose-phosphate isomerase [Gemmatimonadaceae bacterium]|nr:triose-phosphate isomerase [Gemmatimonadaceae bacterium]